MPEIDFDPKFKRAGNEALEFERLKLKKDERARIAVMEKPTFAWVHTLRKPKLVNGLPVKIEKESRRGGTYTDYDMDFVGRPLCLGDYGILGDSGADENNCPACKRATETDEVPAAERRFAMNIVRYGMSRDGSKLVKPFKCDLQVWGFAEGVYNRLIDIAQEHGSLVGRDLILGPCINEGWQKFEIQAGAQAIWQTDEDIKSTVTATYQQNRVEDLERASGRKAEVKWMVKDLNDISEVWRIARGEADRTEAVGSSALDDGLKDLWAGQETVPARPVDIGGMLSGNNTVNTPAGEIPGFAEVIGGEKKDDSFNYSSLIDGVL